MIYQALFVIVLLWPVISAFRVSRVQTGAPRGFKVWSSLVSDGAPADLREIASKFKVVPYGIGSTEVRASIESRDPAYRDVLLSVVLSREGGLGLELEEAERLERGNGYGLVLISGFKAGGNAATPLSGSFVVGDALVGVTGLLSDGTPDTSSKVSVEGLDFDRTLDKLALFSDYEKVQIDVKRLTARKIVNVKVCGPDGDFFKDIKVLSGYGTNMRTILQASNVKLYDQGTLRFDSPYELGNCGGEGTCGTCVVAVTQGANLLNKRVRVEEGALAKQYAPPNWRWACRTLIGINSDDEGDVTIRLRPQSLTR